MQLKECRECGPRVATGWQGPPPRMGKGCAVTARDALDTDLI